MVQELIVMVLTLLDSIHQIYEYMFLCCVGVTMEGEFLLDATLTWYLILSAVTFPFMMSKSLSLAADTVLTHNQQVGWVDNYILHF